MIARNWRGASAAILVPLVLSFGGPAPMAHGAPPAPPEYSPPPREVSPFTSPDSFCTPSLDRFDAPAPAAKIRGVKIVVVVLTPSTGSSTNPVATGSRAGAGDPAAQARAFAGLVNQCGGIGGRRLDLHVLTESGDPVADCLEATQQLHAFVVVSWAASPAQRCIARDQHTVMITESDVSNADLAGTGGRLAATGSSEGVIQARLLDVMSSGRLNGKRVAVVAGGGPSDREFARAATSMLAQHGIRIVRRSRADTLLEPTIDPTTLPALTRQAAGPRHHAPLEIYGVSNSTSQFIYQLRRLRGAGSARMLANTAVYSFTQVTDPQYRDARSPSTFSEMCNKEYAEHFVRRTSIATTSTTQLPDAPVGAEFLQIAKVCLAMRIVARGLFNAGIGLDQQSLIKALHRLPYIDSDTPGGTPKPRPNQIVNEPVARIEQVVVLTRATAPCTNPPVSGRSVTESICWAPVTGWDDGGRVVNAPLVTTGSP